MPKIYFYKMVSDNGGAPCIKNGLLSLAICKPQIRSTAEPGDLIFGFAANSLDADNRMVYVARVTGKEHDGNYYRSRKYAGRGDRVYSWGSGRFRWRQGALYHGPDRLVHDLGSHPDYPRANVLLSSDFRYFGGAGTSDYKRKYPATKSAIEDLGIGHRIHHVDRLRSELLSLSEQAWQEYPEKVNGKPTSLPSRQVCHRSESCGVIEKDFHTC